MRKVKTSELGGRALDWAVGKARGFSDEQIFGWDTFKGCKELIPWASNWALSGKLLDSEIMEVVQRRNPNSVLCRVAGGVWQEGPTILVAAMRAFVHEHLGEKVDVPEELL